WPTRTLPSIGRTGLLDARCDYDSACPPYPDSPWLLAFQPRQRPELELPANGGGRPAAGARRAPARRPARADASPGPGPVGPGRPLSAAVRTAGPAGHAPAGGGHGHRTGSGGLPVAPD